MGPPYIYVKQINRVVILKSPYRGECEMEVAKKLKIRTTFFTLNDLRADRFARQKKGGYKERWMAKTVNIF